MQNYRLNFLTDGFRSPNGRALLFPFLALRDSLARKGLRFRRFDHIDEALTECDVVAIDSKFFRDWWATRADEVIAILDRIARRRPVVWFDTGDSAGWLKPEVLPHVRRYYKNQLYRDRETYLKPLYGQRIYTDFYHRRFGVEDSEPSLQPTPEDPSDLGKLRVSWHSGLADYSLWGLYRMALYRHLPAAKLLSFPRRFGSPSRPRDIEVSCRFGTGYARATVAFQRQEIARRLSHRLRTNKLKRPAYFRELQASAITVSPFGLGEITLKDFEVFLTGSLLLKPRMHPIETWPELFVGGETILEFDWDLSDLEETINSALESRQRCIEIASRGQDRYRHYISTARGHAEICDRILEIVSDAVQ